MRTIIIKDTKIPKDELLALLDDYSDFWEGLIQLRPDFIVEQRDFSQVPTVVEPDGDLKPTPAFRKALCDDVRKRYGDYGVDNIVMLVHEDNFLYRGIWGQNWSYIYGTYSFQLARWDKDNAANSFGTLYHEQLHPIDALVKNEIGVDINPMFHGSWDKFSVHGGRPDEVGKYGYEYVRYQENTDAVKKVGHLIKAAYLQRQVKHKQQRLALLLKLRDLASKLLGLLQQKNGSSQ